MLREIHTHTPVRNNFLIVSFTEVLLGEKKIMKKILAGKVALVTGAGRGLGWGIARALGQAGARVCVSDINDDELARSAADLRSDSSQVIALHLDVSDLDAFKNTVHQIVDKWGRLDIVVHNAIYMPLVL